MLSRQSHKIWKRKIFNGSYSGSWRKILLRVRFCQSWILSFSKEKGRYYDGFAPTLKQTTLAESLWPSKVQGFFTVQGFFKVFFYSSRFSQGFFSKFKVFFKVQGFFSKFKVWKNPVKTLNCEKKTWTVKKILKKPWTVKKPCTLVGHKLSANDPSLYEYSYI